jgi:mannose-6-phosphate isomerase-like protein (cupin superfamily)
MSDFTIKSIDEMRGSFGGGFKLARAELGVTSFGMQVLDMPAGFADYPEHTDEEQEEVFLPLSGSGEMILDGESHALSPGMMIRVGHDVSRKIVPGPEGIRILALGACPGKAYEVNPGTELAALDA